MPNGMSRVAITRRPGPALARCTLTHIEREPIDIELAVVQHRHYEEALARLGYVVISIGPSDEMPDAPFVEDIAVVFGRTVVITNPGEPARRAEATEITKVLKTGVDFAHIEQPATLDGGDVLVAEGAVFVGRSTRTNDAGIEQLGKIAASAGYEVRVVDVTASVHLKTAMTEVADGVFLVNPDWVDTSSLGDVKLVDVPPEEPFAANVIRSRDRILIPAEFQKTSQLLENLAPEVLTIPFSEMLKAEAGVTCCSILFD